jgi:hypothetical protein
MPGAPRLKVAVGPLSQWADRPTHEFEQVIRRWGGSRGIVGSWSGRQVTHLFDRKLALLGTRTTLEWRVSLFKVHMTLLALV